MHLRHAIKGDIVVIGDVMLDCYVSGDAWRISPEAPVPVVAVDSKRNTLGGAGNVALNLASLGCNVWLFGAVGSDQASMAIADLLFENNIIDRLYIDHVLPTTTKTRVIANNQQLLRFDEEGKFNGDNGRYDAMISAILESIERNSANVVVLSDYNKGVLSGQLVSEVITYCREKRIPVLVDPKRGQWEIYRNANIIKPNLFELREATSHKFLDGHDEISAVARVMMDDYNLDAVLVTMGSRGMMLVTAERDEFIPTKAKEVFDVSGAGDTVIATLAACICSGYSLSDSAKIANDAAGIVVGKVGTCPITLMELSEVEGK